MKRTSVLCFIAYLMTATGAMAGGGNNASSLIGAWGDGKLSVCGEHALTSANACIGATQSCNNRTMYARNYTDEWGIQMLVAMNINENGAQFCPVQIESKNKNRKNPWTEYAQLNSNCVWLCRRGYAGENCQTAVSGAPASCDPTKIEARNYSSIKRMASGANIEDNVPMFVFNNYNKCGGNGKGNEHDIILAVTRWTPGGHGAFVQQVVVRAARSGWGDMISWPNIYPASGASEILVCKDGYQPNAGNTDCEPINANVCAQAQACSGWSSGFDENQHVMMQPDGQSCYQFRCSETGYAFRSETDRTCAACATNMRDGVHPVNGGCVKCELGKIFDENARATGYCVDTDAFTKTDMQYGKGNTKNTIEFKFQCWLQVTAEEYKSCVVNGGPVNNGRTPATLSPAIRQINVSGSVPLREFTGKLL